MSSYEEYDDEPSQWPHSGLGIASFIMSLVGELLLLFMIVLAFIMEVSDPEFFHLSATEDKVVGIGMCGSSLLILVSAGLALGGLAQDRRRKIFAILGLIISGAAVLIMGFALLLFLLGGDKDMMFG